MQIRIRETGAVVYRDEFCRLYPDTSFPINLTSDVLNDFGADIVLEGKPPSLTDNQYLKNDGVEQINGQWFTKYVAVDYTPEELVERLSQWRQYASCTPFQGRMALADAGLLAGVEAAVSAADDKTKVAWEYALEWKRMSPMIASLSGSLQMTDSQIDDLFKAAAEISA